MLRYKFIVGVSLAALEQELNRIVNDDPCIKFHQIIYAQGTGFVAVIETHDNSKDENTLPIESKKQKTAMKNKKNAT